MMSRSLLRWFSPAEGSTSEDSHEIDSLKSTTATSYSPVSTNPSSNSLESLSLSSVAADEQQEPESVSESCCLDDQTSSQKALKGSSMYIKIGWIPLTWIVLLVTLCLKIVAGKIYLAHFDVILFMNIIHCTIMFFFHVLNQVYSEKTGGA